MSDYVQVRIGVYVCHCGINIAQTVDVEKVTASMAKQPNVVVSRNYNFMCSNPGQEMIKKDIEEHNLNRIVVAACSPSMHEMTFRKVCLSAGINQYLFQMANIREQCSWTHDDKDAATRKAEALVSAAIKRIALHQPLEPLRVEINSNVLIVGGGIAGIQAALDVAKAGYKVTLVERQPSIGGNMARLSETFPTLDCSQCILTPRMVETGGNPNIELLTYSEVEEVTGYVGNFNVKILKKPRYVNADLCTACNDCVSVCPVSVPNEFDRGLSWRKAIYIPFPQAVPAVYTLDDKNCLGLNPLVCEKCAQACLPKAIDFDQKPEIVDRKVGSIIIATGYELYPAEQAREYGWGIHPDVVDGLEFERMLSSSGPTSGEVHRPSDGKPAKNVVFIQCVGSRDPAHGVPYCSKICCMYTAKHALLYKHKVHGGNAYVFYIDIRAGGKGFEEFVNRVMEEERVLYIRGRVSKVLPTNGKLYVQGVDTLSNRKIEIDADLVVLATAMVATHQNGLQEKLKITADEFGFFKEAHPKLRPVETMTDGIFLAGATQAPKDILETVAQASGAAARVLATNAMKEIEIDPIIASIIEARCSGCRICNAVCPYTAIDFDENKKVSKINEVLCKGCGTCVSACPASAITALGFSDKQLIAELEGVLSVD